MFSTNTNFCIFAVTGTKGAKDNSIRTTASTKAKGIVWVMSSASADLHIFTDTGTKRKAKDDNNNRLARSKKAHLEGMLSCIAGMYNSNEIDVEVASLQPQRLRARVTQSTK